MTREDFAEFRRQVLAAVEEIAAGLSGPGEEWVPFLLTSGEAESERWLVNLSESMEDPDRLELLLEHGIPVIVARARAACAALFSPVLAEPIDDRPLGAGGPPEVEEEERVVVVLSDGAQDELWSASVERAAAGPPTLSGWDRGGLGALGTSLSAALHRVFDVAAEVDAAEIEEMARQAGFALDDSPG